MEFQMPPLTRESYEQPRRSVHPHDHAVCTFDSEASLLGSLGSFLDEGIRRGELCVFVHSFPSEAKAWEFLGQARADAPRLRSDQIVLVSLYTDAFEGGRARIDYDHVKVVVDSLIAHAGTAGRAGVRIFVDASRRYFAEARTREWFDFETWLGRRLQAKVGLVCAYERSDALRPEILPEVLKTHSYRFEG